MASSISATRLDDLFTRALSFSEHERQAACTAIFTKMIAEEDREGIEAMKKYPAMRFYALQYSIENQKPDCLEHLLQGTPIAASDAGSLLRQALKTSCVPNVRLLMQKTIVSQSDFAEAAVEAVKWGSSDHIEAILTGAPVGRELRLKMIAAIDHRLTEAHIFSLIPDRFLAEAEAQEVFVEAASRGAAGLINFLLKRFSIPQDTLNHALRVAIQHRQSTPFDLRLFPHELTPDFFFDALQHEAWQILADLVEAYPLAEATASELAVALCDRKAFDLATLVLHRQIVSPRARAFILTRAAESGQADLMLRLLQEPLDIDQSALGFVLIHAARQRCLEVVHQLLSHFDFANSDLIAAIEPVVASGSIPMTKCLLAKTSSLRLDFLLQLISIASEQKHRDITLLLLKAAKDERILEPSQLRHVYRKLMFLALDKRDIFLFFSGLSQAGPSHLVRTAMKIFFYNFTNPLPVPEYFAQEVALPRLDDPLSIQRIFSTLDRLECEGRTFDPELFIQAHRHSSINSMIAQTRLEMLSESQFTAMSEEARQQMMKQFISCGFGDSATPLDDYAAYCRVLSLSRESHQRFYDRLIGNFLSGEVAKIADSSISDPVLEPLAYRLFFKQIYLELAHLYQYTQSVPESRALINFKLLECMNGTLRQMQAGIHELFCKFLEKAVDDRLTMLFFDAFDAEIQCAMQESIDSVVDCMGADIQLINKIEAVAAQYSYRLFRKYESVGLSVMKGKGLINIHLKSYSTRRLCLRLQEQFSSLPPQLKADFEGRCHTIFPPAQMPDAFLLEGMEGYLLDLAKRFKRFLEGDRDALNACEQRVADAYLSEHGSSASTASENFFDFAKNHIVELSGREELADQRRAIEKRWQEITGHFDQDGRLKIKTALRWLSYFQLIELEEVDEVLMELC